MTRALLVIAGAISLAACSARTPVTLTEGLCPANEAPRCYYATPPLDGF